MNRTWTYTYPEEAEEIVVIFDERTEFENGFDKLEVTDSNGTSTTYTGTQLKGAQLKLPGNSFTLKMTTDQSVTYWGFAVIAVIAPKDDDITYGINDSGLITAAVTKSDYIAEDYVIPEEYDGKTIVGIANNAFSGANWIHGTVTIPEYIQSVGTGAFKNCTNITNAEFDYENRITNVPDNLFQGCTSLESITLPYDAESIGTYAFSGCTSLKDVDLPKGLKTIGSYAFQNCSTLEELDFPAHLTTISSYAFDGCTKLNAIDFPDTLTTINDYAFRNCKTIESVELPSSVTSLGAYVFNGCSGLEYADLSAASMLEKLPAYAFSNCTNLGNVILPSSLTAINDYAFNGCKKLTQINGSEEGKLTLPDSITTIGHYAFADCDALTEATISDSVTSLGTYALAKNDNLEKAVIGAGVKTLPSGLFSNDPKLKSVEFKGPVTEIPAYAFEKCKALEDFELWDGLIKIGAYAFSGCTGLPDVDFPGTLTTIGDYAYDGCTKLKEITFSDEDDDAPLTIGNYAFRSTGVSSIKLPDRLTSLGTYAFNNCTSLTEVDFGDHCQLTSIPGFSFSSCTKLPEIEIPSTIKTIGNGAFQTNSALKAVTFPADSQLESIGNDAFRDGKSLEEIHFPKSLQTIGERAFINSSGLKEIDFPDDGSLETISTSAFHACQQLEKVTLPPSLTTLGSSAFYNCTRLKEADLSKTAVTNIQSGTFQSNTALTSVKLPPNLEIIGNSAFYSCSVLPEIEFPETLKTIGSSAFQYNYKLESVTLPNSVTSIGTDCFYSCSAMKNADLSDGIETIPQGAFAYCTNLEEVDWPAELTTIKNDAFYSCHSLKKIDLPDTVKTIGSNAFRYCYAAESITVPRDCTSIAINAFSDCKSLENMLWDAKDASIASFSSGTKFTLTLGKNVDNLSADALKNLVAGGANMLAFEGENYLTLPDTSNSGFPRPLNNLEAGKYFADAQGALYKINDDGTATLVYVPDGLTEYTIPASLPGEEGGEPVPVTRVRDNALTQAQALVRLKVENPEGFTTLDSYAFAYAANLESVNGETGKALAANLFAGATKGTQLFYGTKLIDAEVTAPVAGSLVYNAKKNEDDRARGWSDSIVVTISQSAQSRREGETQNEQPTRTMNQPLYQDPDTKVYGVYTGESITTAISISNPDSTAIVDGDKIRVYFQLEDGGYINYAPGTYTAVMESIETDANGQKIKENTSFRVVQTAEGAYYLEFDRPRNGYTIGVDIITQYPSPNSAGGDALVWAEYHEREDAIATAGQSSAPDDKYHQLNWTTKRDEFPVTKTTNATAPTVHTEADGITYINSQQYTIEMKRSGSTLEGIGKDHMESADFVDIFTLPEGIKLNDAIRDDIINNRIVYSGVIAQNKYITAPSFSSSSFMSFYASSNAQQYLVP